jgi:hypothetical protein
MGWFDASDELINPPNDKELTEISMVATSEGGFTVMDLDTAMALFETADDLEELRILPRSLLIELSTQVPNNPTKESVNLKYLSKKVLIDYLRDAVRHRSQFFGVLLIVEYRERKQESSMTAGG